jgi:predicted nucleotidyltransferase
MNLTEPISSVIPGAHGRVLYVIARTNKPLTARQVALLTDGGTTKRRANDVLQELTEAGIVLRQDSAPSYLYTLNYDHLACDAILSLASMRERLLERIQQTVTAWAWKPAAVYLYGSTARGEATARSDIDLLVVRPSNFQTNAQDEWDDQVSALSENVHRWSGNYCEILELTEDELIRAAETDNRLAHDLQDHGRILYGSKRAHLLIRKGRAPGRRTL